MTKEVAVTISGLQLAEGDQDNIEMVHLGEYHEKDGVHYLFFDEMLEGHDKPVRNMLKLNERSLSVRKRGPVTAEMIFEEGTTSETAYNVPFGSFMVTTRTTGIRLGVEEEKIEMTASYELCINGEHCSDCDIRVKVEPRTAFRLKKEDEKGKESDGKER